MNSTDKSDESPFWKQPLSSLDRGQWEALCDGCGKCCLHKIEDEDDGRIYLTNVSCRLLDGQTAQCTDYRHRRALVPDCLRLTPEKLDGIEWLPSSCAYRLRADGKDLPDWHYLVSGDRNTIHETGNSVSGKVISETLAGSLENHVIDAEL